jgi:hypothetical protein
MVFHDSHLVFLVWSDVDEYQLEFAELRGEPRISIGAAQQLNFIFRDSEMQDTLISGLAIASFDCLTALMFFPTANLYRKPSDLQSKEKYGAVQILFL